MAAVKTLKRTLKRNVALICPFPKKVTVERFLNVSRIAVGGISIFCMYPMMLSANFEAKKTLIFVLVSNPNGS